MGRETASMIKKLDPLPVLFVCLGVGLFHLQLPFMIVISLALGVFAGALIVTNLKLALEFSGCLLGGYYVAKYPMLTGAVLLGMLGTILLLFVGTVFNRHHKKKK
jgi:hypothetical protein